MRADPGIPRLLINLIASQTSQEGYVGGCHNAAVLVRSSARKRPSVLHVLSILDLRGALHRGCAAHLVRLPCSLSMDYCMHGIMLERLTPFSRSSRYIEQVQKTATKRDK